MRGPFQKKLRPDHRQKPSRPHVSVASYVVDQWRRLAYAGVAFGAVGMAGALAAGAWAMAKERMPVPVYTPIIEGGRLVETYVDRGDEALDERIACAVLRETVTRLRTVTAPKSVLKEKLEVATNAFADKAAIRLRRELDAQDWYAPLVDQRRTREVLPDIECYRLAADPNTYNLKWTERVYTSLYTLDEARSGQRVLSVATVRVPNVPAGLAKWNPWGLMVADYSGVMD